MAKGVGNNGSSLGATQLPMQTPAVGEGQTPFDMSSGLLEGAAGIYDEAQGGFDQYYDRFNNPYTQDVIDANTSSMMRNNEMLLNDNANAAAQGGAFGGARHGVVDAVTNANTVRNISEMEAGLRDRGYNTAMDYAGRHWGNQMDLAGQGRGLAGEYYGIGSDLMDRQERQGDKAHNFAQSVMDAAQGIFAGNDPQGVLAQLQAALGGNPLMGEGTTSGESQYNPGMFETIGGLAKIGGSIAGK